jgi:hypothetical protein
MKVVHISKEKEDPIRKGAMLLVAKWRRRDKAKAEKLYGQKQSIKQVK